MKDDSILRTYALALTVLVAATGANAQFVALGRKVVGKITTVTQPRDSKSPGCDAATVILDADAGKVFSTAVSLLQKNPDITITKMDQVKRTVGFKQADWTLEMRVTELGDKLSQLLIVRPPMEWVYRGPRMLVQYGYEGRYPETRKAGSK